ncbi:MAG: hypothetical protein GY858_06980 [Candidatus Omnitrophica bacterium]|nr:hypothetical protein [Candidatus Omnitrophota bacterium]
MKKNEFLYKVVAFINRDELDFLDKTIKDLYFSTGKKIPRTEMIKEIIHMSKNVHGFKKELIEDLEKKGEKNG